MLCLRIGAHKMGIGLLSRRMAWFKKEICFQKATFCSELLMFRFFIITNLRISLKFSVGGLEKTCIGMVTIERI